MHICFIAFWTIQLDQWNNRYRDVWERESMCKRRPTNRQWYVNDLYVYIDEGKDGMKVNAICRDISVYINITLKNINLNTCRSYLYMYDREANSKGLLVYGEWSESVDLLRWKISAGRRSIYWDDSSKSIFFLLDALSGKKWRWWIDFVWSFAVSVNIIDQKYLNNCLRKHNYNHISRFSPFKHQSYDVLSSG